MSDPHLDVLCQTYTKIVNGIPSLRGLKTTLVPRLRLRAFFVEKDYVVLVQLFRDQKNLVPLSVFSSAFRSTILAMISLPSPHAHQQASSVNYLSSFSHVHRVVETSSALAYDMCTYDAKIIF